MTFTVFERKNQFLIERKDGVSSYTSNICQQKLKQFRGKNSLRNVNVRQNLPIAIPLTTTFGTYSPSNCRGSNK